MQQNTTTDDIMADEQGVTTGMETTTGEDIDLDLTGEEGGGGAGMDEDMINYEEEGDMETDIGQGDEDIQIAGEEHDTGAGLSGLEVDMDGGEWTAGAGGEGGDLGENLEETEMQGEPQDSHDRSLEMGDDTEGQETEIPNHDEPGSETSVHDSKTNQVHISIPSSSAAPDISISNSTTPRLTEETVAPTANSSRSPHHSAGHPSSEGLNFGSSSAAGNLGSEPELAAEAGEANSEDDGPFRDHTPPGYASPPEVQERMTSPGHNQEGHGQQIQVLGHSSREDGGEMENGEEDNREHEDSDGNTDGHRRESSQSEQGKDNERTTQQEEQHSSEDHSHEPTSMSTNQDDSNPEFQNQSLREASPSRSGVLASQHQCDSENMQHQDQTLENSGDHLVTRFRMSQDLDKPKNRRSRTNRTDSNENDDVFSDGSDGEGNARQEHTITVTEHQPTPEHPNGEVEIATKQRQSCPRCQRGVCNGVHHGRINQIHQVKVVQRRDDCASHTESGGMMLRPPVLKYPLNEVAWPVDDGGRWMAEDETVNDRERTTLPEDDLRAPPIILTYEEETYLLFGPPESPTIPIGSLEGGTRPVDTSSLKVLFSRRQDHRLYYYQLEELVEALHQKFPAIRESDMEMRMSFNLIDIEVSEDNVYTREISLYDIDRLYVGCELQGRLSITIDTAPRFISRFNVLVKHAARVMGHPGFEPSEPTTTEPSSFDRTTDNISKDEPSDADFQARESYDDLVHGNEMPDGLGESQDYNVDQEREGQSVVDPLENENEKEEFQDAEFAATGLEDDLEQEFADDDNDGGEVVPEAAAVNEGDVDVDERAGEVEDSLEIDEGVGEVDEGVGEVEDNLEADEGVGEVEGNVEEEGDVRPREDGLEVEGGDLEREDDPEEEGRVGEVEDVNVEDEAQPEPVSLNYEEGEIDNDLSDEFAHEPEEDEDQNGQETSDTLDVEDGEFAGGDEDDLFDLSGLPDPNGRFDDALERGAVEEAYLDGDDFGSATELEPPILDAKETVSAVPNGVTILSESETQAVVADSDQSACASLSVSESIGNDLRSLNGQGAATTSAESLQSSSVQTVETLDAPVEKMLAVADVPSASADDLIDYEESDPPSLTTIATLPISTSQTASIASDGLTKKRSRDEPEGEIELSPEFMKRPRISPPISVNA